MSGEGSMVSSVLRPAAHIFVRSSASIVRCSEPNLNQVSTVYLIVLFPVLKMVCDE